jgi:hypothetical protein
LQGANGSGKSTILAAIATLWDFFGAWIDVGAGRKFPQEWRCFRHYFANPGITDLAAVELKELLPAGKSLWLGMGNVKDWIDLKDEHPHAEFAGLVHSKGSWEVQLPPGDWRTFRRRSQVGAEPQPNLVYFPPERTPAGRGRAPHIIDVTPFSWLAKYTKSVRIASLLLTVGAREPAKYNEALGFINDAIGNQRKRISELGPDGMVVAGETDFGKPYKHFIGGLSSGEKQILLLIGFIAATLRPRGIVIVDEPDLHIHIVMVQQLMGSIEAIVKARGAQLIIAAHSQEVWDWFSMTSERVELNPWRRATT